MQKSVFLVMWDNYEVYRPEILYIESTLALKSENVVRLIAKLVALKEGMMNWKGTKLGLVNFLPF